ncbi:MAG: GIY-YIG nuclease family protein [Nostoc sp. DedQUE08]|uniref:GIY-YIG nuclease family protein n=1 Tax=Nostoc sp. DedQUE08 TaxID=3075393 RepID=UPI002AD2FCC2|nr:GIY-YIG nuclease family protein [Nostoc sp. DedQUE08]MDZ8068846.1 GIY-YIG nuclease family protein [Nostoc sp. DedQUE08]
MDNFFDCVREYNLPLYDLTLGYAGLPVEPGLYLLYDSHGDFIYVGKASNLRDIVSAHFRAGEANARIRDYANYVIYKVTYSVEEAEILESTIFDNWTRITGQYPFANRNRTPMSTITDLEEENIKREYIRKLLEKVMS